MFIDASAIIAILNAEEGHEKYLSAIEASKTPRYFSPVSHFEAVVSLARSRSGRDRAATPEQLDMARDAVDQMLKVVGAKCVMVSESIGANAVTAARTYGKAVGHPAGLNLGDCFAYACAKGYHVPLLYKGDDFARTDFAQLPK